MEQIKETSCIKKGVIEALTNSITLNEKMDNQVEAFLIEMAEDFIETCLDTGCQYAKHKNSDILGGDDVVLAMQKHFNISEVAKNHNLFNQIKSFEINKVSTNDHQKRLECKL